MFGKSEKSRCELLGSEGFALDVALTEGMTWGQWCFGTASGQQGGR